LDGNRTPRGVADDDLEGRAAAVSMLAGRDFEVTDARRRVAIRRPSAVDDELHRFHRGRARSGYESFNTDASRSRPSTSQGARIAMLICSAPAWTYWPTRSTTSSSEPVSTPGRTNIRMRPNCGSKS